MFDLLFGLVALVLIFGGGLLGLLVGRALPEHYMTEGTQKIVQITMGTISVMAALVISLMITTARNTLASRDRQIEHLATDLIILDRELLRYGPDARDAREMVRQYTALKLKLVWPGSGRGTMLDSPESLRLLEGAQDRLLALRPTSVAQHMLVANALQTTNELVETRWALAVEHEHEIPRPFLYALVFWLTVLYTSFGLFAPHNAIAVASLFACAVCLTAAILLIVDMDEPFGGIGIINISPEPMQRALAHMG